MDSMVFDPNASLAFSDDADDFAMPTSAEFMAAVSSGKQLVGSDSLDEVQRGFAFIAQNVTVTHDASLAFAYLESDKTKNVGKSLHRKSDR